MKTDLTSLEHLRLTALEARGFSAEVARTAAEAVAEVAEGLPKVRQVTLLADGWIVAPAPPGGTAASGGSCSRVDRVEGVLSDEAGQIVQIVPANTVSKQAWADAGIQCTGQATGKLRFEAQEKPETDINIFVVLQEVMG